MIREFRSDDKDGVLGCLKEVWSITSIDDDVLDNYLRNSNLLYVIDIDGEIAGCATLHLQKKLIRNGSTAGFIEDVVVKEKYRNNKLGESLIGHLVDKAKEKECYKVILSCYPERIAFYERCGFFQETITMRKHL
jgi:N-acetylglutamate synthase-like GNAT family acetyltransferase